MDGFLLACAPILTHMFSNPAALRNDLDGQVRDDMGGDGERLSHVETLALHAAVASCCIACVDVLLGAGVGVGGSGVDGVRAVHVAARSGSRQVPFI